MKEKTEPKAAEEVRDLEKLKDAKIPTRRVRFLMVAPAEFMFLFTKGLQFRKRTKLIQGIPSDAKLIGVAAEPIRHGIMLVVESSEYDECPINEQPPIQPVEIQTQFGGTKPNKKPRKK